jgi:hypothetical protein
MARLSFRSLMALIAVVGAGLAALRNADGLWAGMLLLVALGALGVAVMGALILRGKGRAWWGGFAFFSGGYLALTLGPWFGETFRSQLGTTHLLEYVHESVAGSSVATVDVSRADARSFLFRVETSDGAVHKRMVPNSASESAPVEDILASLVPANRWRAALPGAANHDAFLGAGHRLFSLLAGLSGGSVAVWFWRTRGRADAASVSRGRV